MIRVKVIHSFFITKHFLILTRYDIRTQQKFTYFVSLTIKADESGLFSPKDRVKSETERPIFQNDTAIRPQLRNGAFLFMECA